MYTSNDKNRKKLPLYVIRNATVINNFLYDARTKEAPAVIDPGTIMPGKLGAMDGIVQGCYRKYCK